MLMNQVQNVIQQMISITDEELNTFLGKSFVKTFPKNHLISKVDSIPNEIYFINKGKWSEQNIASFLSW